MIMRTKFKDFSRIFNTKKDFSWMKNKLNHIIHVCNKYAVGHLNSHDKSQVLPNMPQVWRVGDPNTVQKTVLKPCYNTFLAYCLWTRQRDVTVMNNWWWSAHQATVTEENIILVNNAGSSDKYDMENMQKRPAFTF